MKKKSICAIIISLIILLSLGKVQATENTKASTGLANGSEVRTLEELLQDEEEQKAIEESIDEEKVKAEIEEQEKKDEQMTMSLTSDIDYTVLYNSTYVQGLDGKGFDWFIQTGNSTENGAYFSVYKHDIFLNTNTEVYNILSSSTGKNSYYITYHVRDNIIYIMYVKDYDANAAWGTEYAITYVLGIDTTTSKLVYAKGFKVPQNCTYKPSFAVDGNQNFYFVYRETGLRTFDKNGNLLYDHAPIEDETGKYKIYVKGVSPNNQILFFETLYNSWSPYDYYQSVYEGMQKLNNGVFVCKDAYTVYGRIYPNNYSYNPRWKFLDANGTYAADQYGRIAKFSYNVDSTMGVDREIVLDLNSGVTDYTFYTPEFPNVCQKENTIYMMGSNQNIYKVDLNTLTTTQYLTTEVPSYENVYSMNFYEDTILLCYYSGKYCMTQISLSNSSFTAIKDITITQTPSTEHSIANIVNKYKATKPTYNYSNTIYKVKPSWSNPYSAGSLQDGVINDTLNRLNYYRWLVGVDEISVNTDKMERSQKGAVIQKANNEISHYPTQPSDMSDEFYKEAYDGCNAKYEEGDIYSGNVSYGDRYPYKAIEGFVSDIYNITYGSATGHRQSMLDPKATQVSFGQCEEYSAVSIYYNPEKELEDRFYSFPSAGYFPNTEMLVDEYWSIYFVDDYTGTVSVRLTYNGQQYMATGLLLESGFPALSFKLPTELQSLLGSGNVPAGTTIKVEVLGLKDENQNKVTYTYTVNFFDMASELATPEQIAELIFDYKFYADNNPDLKAVYGYDAVALKNHYIKYGIKEGRAPSAVFNPKYYLYNNQDLKKIYGVNGYEAAYSHFINAGAIEQRPSSAEYYGKYYKTAYKDLEALSSYNLMKHYIKCGRAEGRKATNVIDLTPVSITDCLFNSTIYANVNGDVKKAYGTNVAKLKNHWDACGLKEGRTASLVFDAKYYLEIYPDLKAVYGNDYQKAYQHFINVGIHEGRKGSRYFDVKYYLANNADLQKAYGDNYTKALRHFVNIGMQEGRSGSSSFKLSVYRTNNADLQKAFGSSNIQYYIHYINYGLKENRIAY